MLNIHPVIGTLLTILVALLICKLLEYFGWLEENIYQKAERLEKRRKEASFERHQQAYEKENNFVKTNDMPTLYHIEDAGTYEWTNANNEALEVGINYIEI